MTHDDKNTHKPTGMSDEKARFLAEKQQEHDQKSKLQNYPAQDLRKTVRQEHTNGSTPHKDQ